MKWDPRNSCAGRAGRAGAGTVRRAGRDRQIVGSRAKELEEEEEEEEEQLWMSGLFVSWTERIERHKALGIKTCRTEKLSALPNRRAMGSGINRVKLGARAALGRGWKRWMCNRREERNTHQRRG